MRDVIIKPKVLIETKDENGNDTYIILDKLLPFDRVVTIDNNNYVNLYDQCIQIDEDMIEKVL